MNLGLYVEKNIVFMCTQALPQDVVKVDTLHEVMGISEASQPSRNTSPQAMNTSTNNI